jgi:hypothetical protein
VEVGAAQCVKEAFGEPLPHDLRLEMHLDRQLIDA